jgi:SAUR family protein
VGDASRRFVVRAAHLNHPVFRELLRQAEEEYGFPSSPGPVALPCCDEDRFLDVLRRVSSDEERLLLRAGRSLCCRLPAVTTTRDVAARPLLQGMAVEKLVW